MAGKERILQCSEHRYLQEHWTSIGKIPCDSTRAQQVDGLMVLLSRMATILPQKVRSQSKGCKLPHLPGGVGHLEDEDVKVSV